MLNIGLLKKNVKDHIRPQLGDVIITFLVGNILISAVSILGIPIGIGQIVCAKDVMLGNKVQIENLFNGYRDLNKAVYYVLLVLLIGIISGLGLLLFIVPGIILSLMYSQAIYLFLSIPNCTISQAMDLSKKMMKGHKWELFVFGLSFIGHYLLTIITFGIWGLYFIPFFQIANVEYHEYVKQCYLNNGGIL